MDDNSDNKPPTQHDVYINQLKDFGILNLPITDISKIDFLSLNFDAEYAIHNLPFSTQQHIPVPASPSHVMTLGSILQCSWMCENSIDDQIQYYLSVFDTHPLNPLANDEAISKAKKSATAKDEAAKGIFLKDEYENYKKKMLRGRAEIPLYIPPPTNANLLPAVIANKFKQNDSDDREPLNLLSEIWYSKKKKIYWRFLFNERPAFGTGTLVAFDENMNIWVGNVRLNIPMQVYIGDELDTVHINRNLSSMMVYGHNIISISGNVSK